MLLYGKHVCHDSYGLLHNNQSGMSTTRNGVGKANDRRGQDEKQGFVERLFFCSYVILNKFLVSRNLSASFILNFIKTNGRADLM